MAKYTVKHTPVAGIIIEQPFENLFEAEMNYTDQEDGDEVLVELIDHQGVEPRVLQKRGG